MKNKTEKELLQEVENLRTQIEKLKARKKYGLVWDAKKEPEKVVLDCREKLPVLVEDKKKEIKGEKDGQTNILIEGDNYHSLSVLNYTHKEKVDVIYIDPPYNTGKKKEWMYNDSWVDPDDKWKHSKWLNFISKRLELSKCLLKKGGIVFISIDDNEFAQLKLLCDQIFFEENYIACLPTIMNFKGNNDQFGFSGTHEYTLVYSKNKAHCNLNEFNIEEEDLEAWEEDEIGLWKKGAPLRATGEDGLREKRPKMFYPLIYDAKLLELSTLPKEEFEKLYHEKKFNDSFLKDLEKKYLGLGKEFILPLVDKKHYGRWRWGYSNTLHERLKTDVIVNKTKDGYSLYKKQRPQIGDIPTKKPKSIFYKPEYSSGNGTAQLKRIFGKKVFDNPKPLELIKDLIFLGGNKNALVLDFFAGSGTTGHAVLDLNRGDGGERKFILCTNNEDNRDEGIGVSEDVCYPRLVKIGDLRLSLRYYKTDFVETESLDNATDQDKVELTYKAGEMIAIREETFEEIEKDDWWQIFSNEKEVTSIYFKEDKSRLQKLVEKLDKLGKKTNLYIFSWGKNEYVNEFPEYKNIKVKDIPEPLIDVYKEVAKL